MEKLKGQFPDLARRMVDYARTTLPEFYPATQGVGSRQGQQAFYRWIQGVYDALYRQPELWAGKPVEDDCYAQPWSNEKRQQVVTAMRKLTGKIDDLFRLVMELARYGQQQEDVLMVAKEAVKLTAAKRKLLAAARLHVEDQGTSWAVKAPGYEAMLPTLTALSEQSMVGDGQKPYTFSHCLFDRQYPYFDGVFRSMSGDGEAYDRLLGYLREKGYQRSSLRDGRIIVDWAIDYGRKPTALKDSWGEREHGGITLEYKYAVRRPFFCGLRIPRYKLLLEAADAMQEDVRAMVCAKGKECDGCGYCIQTDKTGKRPRAFVPVSHGGKTYALCTMFPGFGFWYDELNARNVSEIIGLLEFIRQRFSKEEN